MKSVTPESAPTIAKMADVIENSRPGIDILRIRFRDGSSQSAVEGRLIEFDSFGMTGVRILTTAGEKCIALEAMTKVEVISPPQSLEGPALSLRSPSELARLSEVARELKRTERRFAGGARMLGELSVVIPNISESEAVAIVANLNEHPILKEYPRASCQLQTGGTEIRFTLKAPTA